MTIQNSDTTAGAKSIPKTATHLSRDGKWRSFPKVPGLLQYVPTGSYFARGKVSGKLFRQSLLKAGEDSISFATAKLRLPDKLKEFRKPKAPIGTFHEARLLYEADLENDHSLAPESKRFRQFRIKALLKSWPGLDSLKLDKISEGACREWAKKFAEQFEQGNFNNTLGTFRAILERSGLSHDENPTFKIKRLGVKPKELVLPEPHQFEQLLTEIETSGAGQQQACADLVRFLAYSGCRISEARQVTYGDLDLGRGEIRVRNAKRTKTSGHHEVRYIPIIPPMRQLLERLKREQKVKDEDRVCVVGECEKSLTRACGKVGIYRLTHHDLRHLFASVCIESGVDIPTVSRWLGHVDGGALAMRTYGHLRRNHSASMAAQVTFGQTKPENLLELKEVVAG